MKLSGTCFSLALAIFFSTAFSAQAADFQTGYTAFQEQNYGIALAELRPLAEQGDARAQYLMGVAYFEAKGVPQDDGQAAEWYLKSAEQGIPNAQAVMGYLYGTGRGVTQSDVESTKWYRKAADQGDPEAQYNLGSSYFAGRGIEKDDAEGILWFRKAAENGYPATVQWFQDAASEGYPPAQFHLGEMIAEGQGYEQDKALAAQWYRKAVEQGHAEAQFNLAMMLHEGVVLEKNEAEAARLYASAASQGHADAQFYIGWMHETGTGVPKDEAEAVKWYEKAVAQDSAQAQYYLAMMYRQGRGVPQNNEIALDLLVRAKAQGMGGTHDALNEMYASGWAAPKVDENDIRHTKELIVLNESGTVSVNYGSLHWVYQDNYEESLHAVLYAQLDRADLECKRLTESLQENPNWQAGEYTNRFLTSVSVNGRMDYARVLSSILKKYATEKADVPVPDADKPIPAQIGGECNRTDENDPGIAQQALPYMTRTNEEFADNFCKRVERSVSCLENLKEVAEDNKSNQGPNSRNVDLYEDTVFSFVSGSLD